uniref:Ion transport domain-containing protein n=1 Tax=Alexandrium monilatum TaxID=311494 RepID=A0A7S4VXH6_9DINO|mmetsp:Transcript_44018/g.137868  ORF Transcript_44018/g.137868 Transcript_44018/m.137868 type:complete len:581 (+) Transcript_44018:131-1873(+)
MGDLDTKRFHESFERVLSQSLASVERSLVEEVQALVDALASLRTENADLRRRVEGSRALDWHPSETPWRTESVDSKRKAEPCQAVPFDGDLVGLCREKMSQTLSIYDEAELPALPVRRGKPDVAAGRGSGPGCGELQRTPAEMVAQPSPRSPTGLFRENHLGLSSAEAVRQAKKEVRDILKLSKGRQSTFRSECKETGCAQRLVRLALILANAAWIAIDLDCNGKALTDSPPFFQIMEHLFVVLFILDMAVFFAAFRTCWSAARDRWFIFEAVLVIMMVINTWVPLILSVLTDDSQVMEGVGVFSALRLMRFLRITRVAMICQFFPELRTMAAGMMLSIRSVLVTSALLVTMAYAFAVFMRELGMSSEWGEEHFGTVPSAIYTLLFVSLFPDNAPLMEQILTSSWFCASIYCAFLLLSAVMIMNMLIGVLCDGIARASHDEQDERNVEHTCTKLHEILSSIDQDFDGVVSKVEFESIIENEHAVQLLHKVGVDVTGLVSDADFIFDGTSRSGLPFEEFKEEVLSFRKSSVVTNGSVTATRRFLHLSLEHIAARLEAIFRLMAEHSMPLTDVREGGKWASV